MDIKYISMAGLPGWALVHTRAGLVHIKDVTAGDTVLTQEGYCTVKRRLEKETNMVRVTTRSGGFTCAANHRLAVLNESGNYAWIVAADLVAGAQLVTSHVPLEGSRTFLPPSTFPNVVVPELDEDMAWFMGLFSCSWKGLIATAEWWFGVEVNRVRLGVAVKARDQIKRFGSQELRVDLRYSSRSQLLRDPPSTKRPRFARWCQCFAAPLPEPRPSALYEVRCSDEHIVRYFQGLGMYPPPVEVPRCIRLATQAVKLSYLAGAMDSHRRGEVYDPHQVIVLQNDAYLSFARSLQILAYSCGIDTRMDPDGVLCAVERGSVDLLSALPNSTEIVYFPRKCNKNLPDEEPPVETVVAGVSDVVGVRPGGRAIAHDLEVEDRHEYFCDGYLMHDLVTGDA